MANKYTTRFKYTNSATAICGGLSLWFATACNRLSSKYGMGGSQSIQQVETAQAVSFDISSRSVAHAVAQVRAKQLATRDSQDKVKEQIIKYIDEHHISPRQLFEETLKQLEEYLRINTVLDNYLKGQLPETIGFPIERSKTGLQLNMAVQWVKDQGDELIEQIKSGRFYHDLTNHVAPDALPTLQSPSEKEYWGNENPSVSSILLAAILSALKEISGDGQALSPMPGAATNYSFYNPNFTLPDGLVPPSYPFASKAVVKLFGDFQYGGHRYFRAPLVFGPEDASSAVGKATYLTNDQVRGINSNKIREAYNNPDNPYCYRQGPLLQGTITPEQLEEIRPGDIYLAKTLSAIIATKPDNKGNITTLQFNREIGVEEERKRLGGGLYDYNLFKKVEEVDSIYILRPTLEPWHETCTLQAFLRQVDKRYTELFPDGPTDRKGDCKMFFNQ